MDDNKTPDPPVISASKLTDIAQSTADALLEASKHLPTPIPVDSKLHKALEEIRNIPIESSVKKFADADVQVDVKPEQAENQMNSKEANEWLEIAITALSINDQQKAKQYLVKFNNVCPSNQVKMMLDKIQDKILQMPIAKENDKNANNTDPDMLTVNRFIDIAYIAIASKDLAKAQDFLTKAEKLKPTQKGKQLLENVKQGIHKHETDTAEKLIECAMTTMADDQYDVAEMLLKTAWIQCHSESAKQTCDFLIQGEIQRSKQISKQTQVQRKAATEQFVKLAERLISEGHNKVAESILIIACHTDGQNPHVIKLLDNVNKLLYPSKVGSQQVWSLYVQMDDKKGWNTNPLNSVASYKAYYFFIMANKAFEYADDAQLALEFLKEADRIYPDNSYLIPYIEKVKRPVN